MTFVVAGGLLVLLALPMSLIPKSVVVNVTDACVIAIGIGGLADMIRRPWRGLGITVATATIGVIVAEGLGFLYGGS